MLEIRRLREETQAVKDGLAIKNFKDLHLIDEVISHDEKRRSTQQVLDGLKSESKQMASEIGALFKQGKKDEAEVIRAKTGELKTRIKELEEEMAAAEKSMHDALLLLPNVPNEKVPPGKSEEDNPVVREAGTIKELHEGALNHWDILEKHEMMSLELGAKITGAGFRYLWDKAPNCSALWWHFSSMKQLQPAIKK